MIKSFSTVSILLLLCGSCAEPGRNEYKDTSPTSGRLKIYYDEGLRRHVQNQVLTFESQYEHVSIQTREVSENEAVQALFNDSCEAIVISRNLTGEELKAFASKQYDPHYSKVALSGIAVIANAQSPLKTIDHEAIPGLLLQGAPIKDSLGQDLRPNILFDKNNSAVLHYVLDSLLKAKNLSSNCNILNSTVESINYVAKNKNAIAFIDFAWLSDADDSLYKANRHLIKFIAVNRPGTRQYETPNQSSFKLNTYPFTRTIYVIRKTGDFTLAKGFESFVAGPKGQLTFLKQGLLPARQGERMIEVKMEGRRDGKGD